MIAQQIVPGVTAVGLQREGADRRPTEEAARSDYAHWSALVERIQRGNDDAMAELYRHFAKGVRYQLCRQLGPQELDDKVHDTFLIVFQAIKKGDLREPERLMGFVRTVIKRQIARHIDVAVRRRRDQADFDTGMAMAIRDEVASPEDQALARQKLKLMREVLQSISSRDREILARFYLKEQSQEQICSEMRLTETQFRLLKSRAKARFGEMGKKKLTKLPLRRSRERSSAGRPLRGW